MSAAELPYGAGKYDVMDLIEESRRSRASLLWIERLHLGAVAAASLLSILATLDWMGSLGWGLGLGLGILALAALVFGNLARVLIGDLYRQFQYREKFLLFLFHLGVLLVARYILGIQAWGVVFGIVHIFLCLQAIDFIFHARIYAWCMFMMFYGCAFAPDPPGVGVISLWLVFLLASMRLGHVRFRVEQFGEGRGADLRSTLRRSLGAVLAPLLVGYAVFFVAGRTLQLRTITFDPGKIERGGNEAVLSHGDLIWQSALLVALIIVLLALLNWLEKKLRRRRTSVPMEEDVAPTAMREYRIGQAEDQPLAIDRAAGPRERIITAFTSFCDRLERINFGRGQEETAEEYIHRLANLFHPAREVQTAGLETFNEACYGSDDITGKQADDFIAVVDRGIEGIRKGLEDQRASREQRS